MRNDLNERQSRPAPSQSARPRTSQAHARPGNAQDARKSYERYLVLAQAETLKGDRIEAENYYQHAEHYLRSMSANAN
jgi:hypothetical protein